MTVDIVLAYVGLGPGLTMVWAFVALIATIALALLSILIWPARMIIRKMLRGGKPDPTVPPPPPNATETDLPRDSTLR